MSDFSYMLTTPGEFKKQREKHLSGLIKSQLEEINENISLFSVSPHDFEITEVTIYLNFKPCQEVIQILSNKGWDLFTDNTRNELTVWIKPKKDYFVEPSK